MTVGGRVNEAFTTFAFLTFGCLVYWSIMCLPSALFVLVWWYISAAFKEVFDVFTIYGSPL